MPFTRARSFITLVCVRVSRDKIIRKVPSVNEPATGTQSLNEGEQRRSGSYRRTLREIEEDRGKRGKERNGKERGRKVGKSGEICIYTIQPV